jgi:transmembrane sensor
MSTPEQTAFKKLVEKYLDGTASAQETETVESYYQLFAEAPNALDQLNAESQDKLALHLKAGITRKIKSFDKPAVPLYRKWITAAAAVAAITLGVWLYYTPRHPDAGQDPGSAQYVNDIAPGKNGATITLANGKVIALSDAKSGVVIRDEIKYDDGTALSGLQPSLPGGERSMALTASTAKGQTYQFTLPDGTKVWLNADSKLEFPSNFVNSDTRNVKLSGEGYFEVAKDKAHPFLVKTKNQDVTVLGTHFNISSYNDDRLTTTTLVEGSVRVSAFDVAMGRAVAVLKPNQQSIQTPSGGMQVRDVDVSEALDWKNGDFVFKEEPLAEIMRRVSRWYDVDVVYDKEVDQQQTFGGKVSRKRNISQVIKALQATQALKFRIEGKKVYVTN